MYKNELRSFLREEYYCIEKYLMKRNQKNVRKLCSRYIYNTYTDVYKECMQPRLLRFFEKDEQNFYLYKSMIEDQFYYIRRIIFHLTLDECAQACHYMRKCNYLSEV